MGKQEMGVKELLTEIISVDHRNQLNIIPDHVTMLTVTKRSKQVRLVKKIKRGKLTRFEKAEMGLYTLPTKQMKYIEAIPLNKLWCGYFQEHLNLHENERVPEIHERKYEAFSRKLVKTDLHGALVKVVKSKCPTFVNICGIVVMETKNILKVLGKDDRIRTIPKFQCTFAIKYGSLNINLFGSELKIRPVERSTKKMKHDVQIL